VETPGTERSSASPEPAADNGPLWDAFSGATLHCRHSAQLNGAQHAETSHLPHHFHKRHCSARTTTQKV
jgi:hypothetical protein